MGLHIQGRYLTSEKFEGVLRCCYLFINGRAELTGVQGFKNGSYIWVIIGTDDFSIINQGSAGEVYVVGVLSVLLRASVAEVHG